MGTKILFIIISFILLIGCAGTAQVQTPDWYKNELKSDTSIFSTGTGRSGRIDFASNKARMDAQENMVKKINIYSGVQNPL